MIRFTHAPLLQAISRQRAIATLLALQVALAVAACANTCAMLAGDLAAMRLPSGMDEAALVALPMPTQGMPNPGEDLARLQALPGVRGVTVLGGVPFGLDISVHAARAADGADGVAASEYQASPGALATLGLRLVAGRDFTADEAAHDAAASPAVAIVAQALARRLHGSPRAALGAPVYVDGMPFRIVGVVQRLLRGQPSADAAGEANGFSLLLPGNPDPRLGAYLLRTTPGDARRVAVDAAGLMAHLHGQPMEVPGTLADDRAAHFAKARADVALLLTATLAFVAVTAIGVFGLSYSWVRKRSRAIGIRRALGASRGAIVRGLLAENAAVVAAGNALGAVLAIVANRWLASHGDMGALPPGPLAAALVATWLVAAAAASIPALRAASIAPADALRFS